MKEKVLLSLKENIDKFISGEMLSDGLSVSRTAVWKYINELKKEGYGIESSSRKGYRLVSTPDILSPFEISTGLQTDFMGREIYCLPEVDSTNNYAKNIAAKGCSSGTLVVAESQTSGRGRLGRVWDSKGGKGIWMSLVLYPGVLPHEVQIITIAASVAVVRAIESAAGIKAGIKWPNDIILGGKKVCGILTEMSCEPDRINYIVLGIGINANHQTSDFAEELKDKATSLRAFSLETNERDVYFNRAEIIRKVLFELERVYVKIENGALEDILEDWKKYSVTLGSEVAFNIKDIAYTGTAEGITKDGRLAVLLSDGTRLELQSGEVQVRGLLGYV